jgi:phage terminase large subunit-like protein
MSLQSQPGASKDYVGIARQYCSDVIDGTVPACKWVQLACKRQVTDMLRADLHWHFSDSHASRVCRFIEKLPHIKGKFATRRELIKLEPWQIFILTTIFGWVDDHGNRRFLTAYLEIPRKNAKSTLVAGMALYCTFAEGEAGAEGYSAATTAEQAAVIFKIRPQPCALRLVSHRERIRCTVLRQQRYFGHCRVKMAVIMTA